jgi:predicted kinase
MRKIFITKGLPGSGKSTWAKQYITDHPNTIRVNKDDIRAMLHNGRWSKSNEKETLRIRDYIIMDALERNCDVIVDDTNLNDTHEKHIAEITKGLAIIEIKDFLDVPVEECIKRDLARPNSVGQKVILQMYYQYLRKDEHARSPLNPLVFDESLPSCVIFDIDGTLACVGDRSPYDAKSCALDLPNKSIIALNEFINVAIIEGFKSDTKVFLLSGRKEEAREETEKWMKVHGVQFDKLFMRDTEDNRKDSIIKKELFEKHIKDQYNVLFIVDDRDQVVEMWRSIGITVLQCNYGNF